MKKQKPFNVVSLFDGVAGARVALDKAGIPVNAYYASEVDKYAMAIAQKNWPDIVQIGDVKTISERFDFDQSFAGGVDLLITSLSQRTKGLCSRTYSIRMKT